MTTFKIAHITIAIEGEEECEPQIQVPVFIEDKGTEEVDGALARSAVAAAVVLTRELQDIKPGSMCLIDEATGISTPIEEVMKMAGESRQH